MSNTKLILISILIISLSKSESDLLSNSTHCKDGTDPYCLSCGISNENDEPGCILCAASFIDSSSKICKVPSSTVDNCGTYDSTSQKCIECRKGFFISSDGFCVEHSIEGCIDPLNQNECRECNGFVLKNDKTCDLTKSCSLTGCSTCQIQDNQEKCSKCQEEYIFTHASNESEIDNCTQLQSNLEGCSVMKDSKCIACKFGFYINSKIGDEVKCSRSPAYESEYIMKYLITLLFIMLSIKA